MKTLVMMALLMGQAYGATRTTTAALAEKIVELRAEVEILNADYLANKAELTNQLKAKGARISQLETQIGQEEVRKQQATEKIAAIIEQLKKSGEKGSELTPFVQNQIIKITLYVDGGLPFKQDKRLKEATDIQDKLEAGVITAEAALGRAWALLEDEMRLTRENALHRQIIFLNGEERLATVAKVGMILMYFHTADNKVGYATRNEKGNYVFTEETKPERKDLIFSLVDGLRKQIRHGRYDLPIERQI